MTRPNIDPFEVADVEYFYGSTYLQNLHRQSYRGHEGNLRSCGMCGELVIHSLACLAGTARQRGQCRDELIREQRERGFGTESNPFPQSLLTNYVRRGFEMFLPATGRVAKPARAARGRKFAEALQQARVRGTLVVSVDIAQQVLEQVIRVVQAEGEPRTEAGRLLPFGYLAYRVHEAVGPSDAGDLTGEWSSTVVERVWHEIVVACEGTNAEGDLDKHVFRYSAQLSTAFLLAGSDDDDGHDDGFIDAASDRFNDEVAMDAGVTAETSDDAVTDSTGVLDGLSAGTGYVDAVHDWARAAAEAARSHADPLDALSSAAEQVLASALDAIGYEPPEQPNQGADKEQKRLRSLRSQIVRQATRLLIWDAAVEFAVTSLRAGGRLALDDLDLIVEVLYGLLLERDYPFEKEELDWNDPAVRRVALRAWAQRIVDRLILGS